MHRRLLLAFGLASSAMLFPPSAAGQSQRVIPAALLPLPGPWVPALAHQPMIRPSYQWSLPDAKVAGRRRDYTVAGLVIGAALGAVAGYAFYNTLCEAVDNECSDSRAPHLLIGAGLGGGLGALIGSLAD